MSPPTLPSTSMQMSLLLCKQAASNNSTQLKNPSLLVPSYISLLTNMWSKFLYWVDSMRDLRPYIWAICTAWFCCVCSCNCTLVACWTVNSCITDLFMSGMLWSFTEPLCYMNVCLGGPWDPKSPGRLQEPLTWGPGGPEGLLLGSQGTWVTTTRGSRQTRGISSWETSRASSWS